jgi:hypothetical protein
MDEHTTDIKSFRSAPTVQSKFLTRLIIWQRVALFFTRRTKGISASAFLSSNNLKATGKDLSRIKRSILRIGCSQSRVVLIYFSFQAESSNMFRDKIIGSASSIWSTSKVKLAFTANIRYYIGRYRADCQIVDWKPSQTPSR